MKAQIDDQKCKGCTFCRPMRVCPYGAIKVNEDSAENKKTVDPKKCTGCGLCIPFCDNEAIKIIEFIEPED